MMPHIKAILDSHQSVLLVVDEAFAQLLPFFLPNETRILFYPRKKLSSSQPFLQRLKTTLTFLKKLRQFSADTLIELEGESLSTTLTFFTKAQRKIGPFFSKKSWVFTELKEFPHLTEHRWQGFNHMCQEFHRQQLPLDYAPVHLQDSLTKQVKEKLDNWGRKQHKPLVAIHVGATKDYKLWAPEKFAKVIEALHGKGYQMILIGAGKKDQHQITQLKKLLNVEVLDSSDQLSLPELMHLFGLCKLYIGNDSGPMHLATACGTQTYGLFGPTNDTIWAPVSDHAQVIRGSQSCASDCRRTVCSQNYRCMTSLTPEIVLEAINPS